MHATPSEQVLANILKFDTKATSYKIALLRALNDLVLLYPDVASYRHDVAVPLVRLAELWAAYYWPLADEQRPIYQGARIVRDGTVRQDVSFRPALTHLRAEWQRTGQLSPQAADGFFLLTEMRTPRRRATYAPALQQAYDQAIAALVTAVKMPIQHAGSGHWTVFAKPVCLSQIPHPVVPLPSTSPHETCVVVPFALWEAFQRLSLYVEALCIHEWCLFTERVTQEAGQVATRGEVYTLLTARPNNRRPLSWERNQIDVLLHENIAFVCPWTRKQLTLPQHYDLDHLLPLAVYPVNELWNLLPVDREFNQRVKRDRVPSGQRLRDAEPLLAAAYVTYGRSKQLGAAVLEDAGLRFTAIQDKPDFTDALANRTVDFIERIAAARYVTRF